MQEVTKTRIDHANIRVPKRKKEDRKKRPYIKKAPESITPIIIPDDDKEG